MQPQTELILNIRDKVQEIAGIEAVTDELTDDGRIYLEIGSAVVEKKYARGPALWMVPVMFLIKKPSAWSACQKSVTIISGPESRRAERRTRPGGWISLPGQTKQPGTRTGMSCTPALSTLKSAIEKGESHEIK